jgi:hypothetical protein
VKKPKKKAIAQAMLTPPSDSTLDELSVKKKIFQGFFFFFFLFFSRFFGHF